MALVDKSTLGAAAARVFLATALGILMTGCSSTVTNVPVEQVVTINTESVVTSISDVDLSKIDEPASVSVSETFMSKIDEAITENDIGFDITEEDNYSEESEEIEVETESFENEVVEDGEGFNVVNSDVEKMTLDTWQPIVCSYDLEVLGINVENGFYNTNEAIYNGAMESYKVAFNDNIFVYRVKDLSKQEKALDNAHEDWVKMKYVDRNGNVTVLQDNIYANNFDDVVKHYDNASIISVDGYVDIDGTVGYEADTYDESRRLFNSFICYAVDADSTSPIEVTVEGRQKLNQYTDVDTENLIDYNILIGIAGSDYGIDYNGEHYDFIGYERESNTARLLTYNEENHSFEFTNIFVDMYGAISESSIAYFA